MDTAGSVPLLSFAVWEWEMTEVHFGLWRQRGHTLEAAKCEVLPQYVNKAMTLILTTLWEEPGRCSCLIQAYVILGFNYTQL